MAHRICTRNTGSISPRTFRRRLQCRRRGVWKRSSGTQVRCRWQWTACFSSWHYWWRAPRRTWWRCYTCTCTLSTSNGQNPSQQTISNSRASYTAGSADNLKCYTTSSNLEHISKLVGFWGKTDRWTDKQTDEQSTCTSCGGGLKTNLHYGPLKHNFTTLPPVPKWGSTAM